MRGDKAQQMLKRDIQNCVNELNELARLHEVKNPIPTKVSGRIIPQDPEGLQGNGLTNETGIVFSGELQYTNFDGCMYSKGWERTNHLPYSIDKRIDLPPRREPYRKSKIIETLTAPTAPEQTTRTAPTYENVE